MEDYSRRRGARGTYRARVEVGTLILRRKVIQDFANLFCQRFVDLPSGYDLASLAHYGSGEYRLDILNGRTSFKGLPIPKFQTCDEYKDWMFVQMGKHHIARDGIVAASLNVVAKIDMIRAWPSYGHTFASAHFSLGCESEIKTDERSYLGKMAGKREWGFNWYYERLYGDFPTSWLAPNDGRQAQPEIRNRR